MRIESTVVVEQKESDLVAGSVGVGATRTWQHRMDVPAVAIRGLDELITIMQNLQAQTAQSTWDATCTLVAERVDTPLPYRISLAFEETGHTLRVRETVELGTLPAPGGPRALQAIRQQIDQDLALWQHHLAPSTNHPAHRSEFRDIP